MSNAAKELFDDLLNLEINVIVKAGMTARKMPDVPHALLDIFTDYDLWLCARAGDLSAAWERFRPTPQAAALRDAAPPDSRLTAGGELLPRLEFAPLYDSGKTIRPDDFDQLRERARQSEEMHRALVQHDHLADQGWGIILKRIFRNCDQIKGILEGREMDGGRREADMRTAAAKGLSRKNADPGALPLTADEVLVVRKIWEVGTETVAMQTVAQLDGDVITRVQQARMTAADKPLHDLHKQAVGNALEHWQFLVATLVQITTRAAGFLGR